MPFPVTGRAGMRKPAMIQPAPQTTAADKVPAPIAGINAVSNISEMGPTDAIVLSNIVPSQYGCKVRSGWSEWCTNVGSGGIRTVIPFTGSTSVEDRLFACAQDGIYEVSASTTTPTLLETFPTSDTTSGYGVWTNYTTIAGKFALFTDESNGYYYWTEATDDWIKVASGTGAGQIDGVDPAELAGVAVYRNRAWFVRKNSAIAYYLPAGLITGRVTEFNFGNKFRNGGNLAALFTWTVDGGEGLNSYLVAISTSGDVVVYQGTDPDIAGNFQEKGNWFIGKPPAGRRLAGSFGGELYLLSRYGLLPMSKLISGSLVQESDIHLTRKITPLINNEMSASLNSLGWEVRLVPNENVLLIATPKRVGYDYKQFVQSTNSEGWALFETIPYFTGDTWHEQFYIGTSDNRVLLLNGDLDNVLLADPNAAINIEWTIITAFREPGPVGTYNRVHFIRPVFMAQQAPSYSVEARYDYNISAAMDPGSAPLPSGAVWDIAIWDVDLWGGEFQIVESVAGASGMGRAIAVAMRGSSASETTFLRFDVMADGGNLGIG